VCLTLSAFFIEYQMIKKSLRLALRITTFVISSFLLVAVTLILANAMAVRKGPDLEWWHTEIISSVS
jgi:hypothetical protein